MANRGRPTVYTQAAADAICARLAAGQSLRAICKASGMPPESTVREWVIYDTDGFAAQYARSRDIGLDVMADEMLEIADTPQLGVVTKTTDSGIETTESDMIAHRRMRWDARRWYLAKLAPKRYGDKLETTHKGDPAAPVQIVLAGSDIHG